jgi:hypothetical protein
MQAFFAGVEYGDRAIDTPGHRRRLAQAKALAPRMVQLKLTLSEAWNAITGCGNPLEAATTRNQTASLGPDQHGAGSQNLRALVDEVKKLKAKKAKLE